MGYILSELWGIFGELCMGYMGVGSGRAGRALALPIIS